MWWGAAAVGGEATCYVWNSIVTVLMGVMFGLGGKGRD